MPATDGNHNSVLKANLRRYARLEHENTELHHLLTFERAVNKAHDDAAAKSKAEIEKLRGIVKELDELHSPGRKSNEHCGGCGQYFPCDTRLIIDGKEVEECP